MDSYKTRLKDINTFIFDVDGVMTNGKIIYTHDGKIDRQFYAKDGYAIKYAISKGYRIAIISGGMQENVRKRLNSLGCLLYTSPSPRDAHESRMPSSA